MTWKDTVPDRVIGDVIVIMGFYFFFMGRLFLSAKSWFLAEVLYFMLLAGSVWAAFRDPIFGLVYAVFLTVLLIPFYHAWALAVCFTWHAKLQSFIGREGTIIESVCQGNVIIEIEGEEFDASLWRNDSIFGSWTESPNLDWLECGTPVVVIRTGLAHLHVKQKSPSE
jgi:membrane protein implicated in regulation of membrane protease activity